MIPKKIQWFLGYNNLGLILEQERKHWLMKTDKRKQLQDKITGDIFQGQIDNLGSDIIIESEKLPIRNDVVPTIKFDSEGANEIFDIDYAAFPFSIGAKGLLFARITSINFPMETNHDLQEKNYRLVFKQAYTKTLLFGISPYSGEVYSGKWIETSTPPELLMMDDNGEYTINVPLRFTGLKNVKYYYPLEEGLQPFYMESTAYLTYTSETINDDGYIGYPLFWFASDETRTGPTVKLSDDGSKSPKGNVYMYFSNEGNSSSRYRAKAYVNVDGAETIGATPDDLLPENYKIKCSCIDGENFNNSDSDFSKPIKISSISFYKKDNGVSTPIPIELGEGENSVFTMSSNVGWEYENETTYSIEMSKFTANCSEQAGKKLPLVSIFDIQLDEMVPFYTEQKKDLGVAGIRMTSANPSSDIYGRFPYDLDQWSGLPTWYTDEEGEVGKAVPQHMAIYAIHNTPMYSENIPESRQVAALLLDPGKMKTEDSKELSNDEIGRIYVISNDDPEYVNNATAKYPKPERTVARICDIPTSITDFMDVDGLVPVAVVDPDYVRSEVSYTEADKNRLFNTLASKFVTPEAVDASGVPFYIENGPTREPYKYIWQVASHLDDVDLVGHNNFREWINLNPVVDPKKIIVSNIVDGGHGYEVNSVGIIVIGGVSLNYTVNEVEGDGVVTDVTVFPQDENQKINLSNFNMDEGNSGRTQIYGTMGKGRDIEGNVIENKGEGLKVVLQIQDYASIITRQGKIFPDLFALVMEDNVLRIYKYATDSRTAYGEGGKWMSYSMIGSVDKTSSDKDKGGYSTADAITRSIVPYFNKIDVCQEEDGRSQTTIDAMSTASFINIIDTEHTPFSRLDISSNIDNLKHVDLCKFFCPGIIKGSVKNHTRHQDSDVWEIIEASGILAFDCYIIWGWENPNDVTNPNFSYGVIRRSFNNYLTTDTTTTIPPQSMKYDSFVNVNAGTTVVWDVPGYGPMMWVYNPNYKKHERYYINTGTQDIYISYTNEEDPENPNIMSWSEVDIRLSTQGYEQVYMVNPTTGLMNFNVYTNNPVQSTKDASVGIKYTEKDFIKIVSQGDDASKAEFRPVGNWQLVFPRVNMYRLTNEKEGIYHSATKLRLLTPVKGRSLGSIENVLDSNGNNINEKTILIDENSSGATMKVYNSQRGTWDTV